MKKTLKLWLHRVGLLNVVHNFYFNFRTASPSVIKNEFTYRRRGFAPDGFPLPPPRHIFDVIVCRWADVFLDSGKRIVDDMEAVLSKNGKSLASFESILDFGCGCGRLIRQIQARTKGNSYGTDYNPELVAWCDKNLPFGRFTTNELAPPFRYGDESFDFIYARSVFTHLPEELQLQWMQELRRVLRKGGCVYFTTHGRPLTHGLSEKERAAFEAGEIVVTYSTLAGQNMCSTFSTRSCVETKLLSGFTLLDFVEGRDKEHFRQDIYLAMKN